MRALRLRAAIVLCALVSTAPRVAGACIGDCDGDGRVTVAEIVAAVAAAQGEGAPCPGGAGAIEDLVRAVGNAVRGCPTATAGPSGTPTETPTVTRTPTASRTPTSCVSEAPNIREDAAPRSDDPFTWSVGGYSRVLLHGRGSVHACLNDRTPVPVSRLGSQEFTLAVSVNRLGRNRLAVCTSPSGCGTPYCARRDIYCNGLSCTFSGPLPTARPTAGFCRAE